MQVLIIFVLIFYGTYSSSWYFYEPQKCPPPSEPIVEYYMVGDFQYIFFSERVTWNEAELICPFYGGELATVDTPTKAKALAEKIADSNIEMEDIWVGGHRVDDTKWVWPDNSDIPLVPVNNFPPWIRIPSRKTKECLAMDRRKHDFPLFIDLDCSLPKPFMCQKGKKTLTDIDITPPSQWISNGNSTFILYNNKITWIEAAAFCRIRGYRLAIVRNNNDIKLLAKAMVRSRPSFEKMWIAGYYYGHHWRWLPTGEIIPNYPNPNTNYPPWYYKHINRTDGCTVLDRHLNNMHTFVVTACNQKRDFICEKYKKGMELPIPDEPVPGTYNKIKILFIPKKLTWIDAVNYCKAIGGYLAEADNPEMLDAIIAVLSDQAPETKHVWLGGKLEQKRWVWAKSNASIMVSNTSWCDYDDDDDPHDACLNLDKKLNERPILYGLKCNNKQEFVCMFNTLIPIIHSATPTTLLIITTPTRTTSTATTTALITTTTPTITTTPIRTTPTAITTSNLSTASATTTALITTTTPTITTTPIRTTPTAITTSNLSTASVTPAALITTTTPTITTTTNRTTPTAITTSNLSTASATTAALITTTTPTITTRPIRTTPTAITTSNLSTASVTTAALITTTTPTITTTTNRTTPTAITTSNVSTASATTTPLITTTTPTITTTTIRTTPTAITTSNLSTASATTTALITTTTPTITTTTNRTTPTAITTSNVSTASATTAALITTTTPTITTTPIRTTPTAITTSNLSTASVTTAALITTTTPTITTTTNRTTPTAITTSNVSTASATTAALITTTTPTITTTTIRTTPTAITTSNLSTASATTTALITTTTPTITTTTNRTTPTAITTSNVSTASATTAALITTTTPTITTTPIRTTPTAITTSNLSTASATTTALITTTTPTITTTTNRTTPTAITTSNVSTASATTAALITTTTPTITTTTIRTTPTAITTSNLSTASATTTALITTTTPTITTTTNRTTPTAITTSNVSTASATTAALITTTTPTITTTTIRTTPTAITTSNLSTASVTTAALITTTTPTITTTTNRTTPTAITTSNVSTASATTAALITTTTPTITTTTIRTTPTAITTSNLSTASATTTALITTTTPTITTTTNRTTPTAITTSNVSTASATTAALITTTTPTITTTPIRTTPTAITTSNLSTASATTTALITTTTPTITTTTIRTTPTAITTSNLSTASVTTAALITTTTPTITTTPIRTTPTAITTSNLSTASATTTPLITTTTPTITTTTNRTTPTAITTSNLSTTSATTTALITATTPTITTTPIRTTPTAITTSNLSTASATTAALITTTTPTITTTPIRTTPTAITTSNLSTASATTTALITTTTPTITTTLIRTTSTAVTTSKSTATCNKSTMALDHEAKTFKIFFIPVVYKSAVEKCHIAGGKLAAVNESTVEIIVNMIKAENPKCAETNFWVHATGECSQLNIKKQTTEVTKCSLQQGFICEITCKAPTSEDYFDQVIWQCNKQDTLQCKVFCKPETVLIGADKIICTNVGWVTNLNETTYLPTCEGTDRIIQLLKNKIDEVNNMYTGFLFIVDESFSITIPEWWIQLEFVASLIQVFPLSIVQPMGLIMFSRNVVVHIPYNQTNTCEALNIIYNLGASQQRDFTYYKDALEEAKRQIKTLQQGRKSFIFFISDGDNNGDEYDEILKELKKDNLIISVGINMEQLNDLNQVASMEDDKLLMYKFQNFKQFKIFTEDLLKYRSEILKCAIATTAVPTTTISPVIPQQCHHPAIPFRYNSNIFDIFFTPFSYKHAVEKCNIAGGRLATINETLPEIIINAIKTNASNCTDVNLWINNVDNCSQLNLHKRKIETAECTLQQGFICDITCTAPKSEGIFKQVIWECDEQDTIQCDVHCQKETILIGADEIICTDVGWVTNSNRTTYLPYCDSNENVIQHVVGKINELNNTYSGFLFIVDESFSITIPEWWMQLEFVASLIQVFPLSTEQPMGLIMFSSNVEVHIPYKQTNTCEALNIIYNLHASKQRDFTYFKLALEEAKRQIETFQQGRKSLIFFVSDGDNNGDEYDEILNELKQDNLIISVGINTDQLNDLHLIASMEEHSLLMYKFQNFGQFKKFTEELLKQRSELLKCVIATTAAPITTIRPVIPQQCHHPAILFHYNSNIFEIFFTLFSYKHAVEKCNIAGGRLAKINESMSEIIINTIKTNASNCTDVNLWINNADDCSQLNLHKRKIETAKCTLQQGFICEIICSAPKSEGIFKQVIWQCKDKGTVQCEVSCQQETILIGADNILCTDIGWVTNSNETTYLPQCDSNQNLMQHIVDKINELHSIYSGFLFIVDESSEWKKQLEFVASLIQVFPLSIKRPMGLIMFSRNVTAHIPYKQTDTCEALNIMYNLQPSEQRDLTYFKQAFEEANRQIKTFQQGRKSLIFFISDGDNDGDEYGEILNKLKIDNLIISMGISSDLLEDLNLVASMNDHKLLMYKFQNFKQFEKFNEGLLKYSSETLKCTIITTVAPNAKSSPLKQFCYHPAVAFGQNSKIFEIFFSAVSYTGALEKCNTAGGRLAEFKANIIEIADKVSNLIRNITCAGTNFWLHGEAKCSQLNLQQKNVDVADCAVPQHFICETECITPKSKSIFNETKWSCENDTTLQCEVHCQQNTILVGADEISCTDNGWVTNSNKTTYLPLCYRHNQVMQNLIDTINELKDTYKGFLFIVDESFSVTALEWSTQIQFIETLIHVFPLSPDMPMGLLLFSTTVRVPIPYQATITCQVLKVIRELSPAKKRDFTYFKDALQEADKQIKKFQPNRKSIIFFISDGDNNGDEYDDILNKLKKNNIIISVGINTDMLSDLNDLASMYNDKLLMYKFQNFKDLETFNEDFLMSHAVNLNCHRASRSQRIQYYLVPSITTTIQTLSPHTISCDHQAMALKYKSNILEVFYTPVSYSSALEKCEVAGGTLAAIKGNPNMISSKILKMIQDTCKDATFWVKSKEKCSQLDLHRKSIEVTNCSLQQGFMCDIECKIPESIGVFNETIWDCDQNNILDCRIHCKHQKVLLGTDNVICTDGGWTTNLNQTTYLPFCHSNKNAIEHLIYTIQKLKNTYTGLLFMVDESLSISIHEWWTQLQFIASLIQVFPLSTNMPMGLIIFSRTVNIPIPYEAQNSCKVLETFQEMNPNTQRDLTLFKQALEEAENQIKTFQHDRKSLIFFISDGDSVGENYNPVLAELKKNNFFITVGINKDPLNDLNVIASMKDDELSMYKFQNFRDFKKFALDLMDHRSEKLQCPPSLYTLPKNIKCYTQSTPIEVDGITYIAFFTPLSYSLAKQHCKTSGGRLANMNQINEIINVIMEQALGCFMLELWINAKELSCSTLEMSHTKLNDSAADCSKELGFICEIGCTDYPTDKKYIYNNWNCTTVDKIKECYVTCQFKAIMVGTHALLCTADGWVTPYNHTIYFPVCLVYTDFSAKFMHTMEMLKKEHGGFLFIFDRSYYKSKTKGDLKQLIFMEAVINIFPPSPNFPVGLILFDEDAKVHIPYTETNYCKVEHTLHVLQDKATLTKPVNRLSYYNKVLKQAENQISKFQPSRRTLIFFVSDRINSGEDYTKTVANLKKKHTILSVGNDYDGLDDLNMLASINSDNLLMFTFKNYTHLHEAMDFIKKKHGRRHKC